MLSTVGKIAFHTTITLGSAWLASITYCKVYTFMNNKKTNLVSYKITKKGLGISMLMGATIGLGSSIIFISENANANHINNMHDCNEVITRCSGE